MTMPSDPFPVMAGASVTEVPWWFAAIVYDAYRFLHPSAAATQPLSRIAERGGFSLHESFALMSEAASKGWNVQASDG